MSNTERNSEGCLAAGRREVRGTGLPADSPGSLQNWHLLWLACVLTVPAITPAAVQTRSEVVLHNFASPPKGSSPVAGVIRDSSGNLYGTTPYGGSSNWGVVFKVDTAGHAKVLYNFTGGADGGYSSAGVIRDSSGNLYGTTALGGAANVGVVFKLDKSGHQTVLHSFTGAPDGAYPHSGVLLDSAGNLYGTAYFGGSGHGVVYKLDPAGNETLLYTFTGGPDGGLPSNDVILDPAGNLYGTTLIGGAAGLGVVFKLNPAGNLSVLHSFTGGADGCEGGPLIRDSSGNLYGSSACGSASAGVVYRIDKNGNESLLYTFTGGDDGSFPSGGLVRDASGNLYGTTSVLGVPDEPGVVFKVDPAGNETVLYRFTGASDGGNPTGALIRDTANNLYGVTNVGGTAGLGVVYEFDTTGHENVLYNFQGPADGSSPQGGLIRDKAGSVYGATGGGVENAGVVFKLDAAGHEKLLHTFSGADGRSPYGDLVRDSQGSLYGTTYSGGAANAGVVYKLDSVGDLTVLYNFTGGLDGGGPQAGVARDPAGNLYGTTSYGGSGSVGVVYKLDTDGHETVLHNFSALGGPTGAGVVLDSAGNLYGTILHGSNGNTSQYYGQVYKLDPTGFETVLYNFTGGTDGAFPNSGVILDSDGNLYGTALSGGTAGWGVVYRVDKSGQEKVLYNFQNETDGANPQAGVIRSDSGKIYGTTSFGNAGFYGVVFELDNGGNFTVLYNFTDGADGGGPLAGVIRDSAGNLYGTTYGGGNQGAGVVFKLVPQ